LNYFNMTHKEFFYWLEGYLSVRDEKFTSNIDVEKIRQKMKEVEVEKQSIITEFLSKTRNPIQQMPINPVKSDEDDLGKPPKIVM